MIGRIPRSASNARDLVSEVPCELVPQFTDPLDGDDLRAGQQLITLSERVLSFFRHRVLPLVYGARWARQCFSELCISISKFKFLDKQLEAAWKKP